MVNWSDGAEDVLAGKETSTEQQSSEVSTAPCSGSYCRAVVELSNGKGGKEETQRGSKNSGTEEAVKLPHEAIYRIVAGLGGEGVAAVSEQISAL
jgi:hypothetical protein